MQEMIVKYLAQGMAQAQVAAAVGCSEGYVSQLLQQENIKEMISEARAKLPAPEEEEVFKKKYVKLEDAVLNKLTNDLPYAEYKEVIKLMEILNRRKEIKAPAVNIDNRQQTVVLNIPQAAVPEIQLNANKEVIGIGDKSLAPMGAGGVKAMFLQLAQRQQQRQREEEAEEAEIISRSEKAEIQSIPNLDASEM